MLFLVTSNCLLHLKLHPNALFEAQSGQLSCLDGFSHKSYSSQWEWHPNCLGGSSHNIRCYSAPLAPENVLLSEESTFQIFLNKLRLRVNVGGKFISVLHSYSKCVIDQLFGFEVYLLSIIYSTFPGIHTYGTNFCTVAFSIWGGPSDAQQHWPS